jgi:hypothetical protein
VKVVVIPADSAGCGSFRMIWPGEALASQGHDVTVIPPDKRQLRFVLDGERVTGVKDPTLDGADVVILQRVTHRWVAEAIPFIRAQGIAVVVDVDDDLGRIHPRNPAFEGMHPRNEYKRDPETGRPRRHSWQNLSTACRNATMVTVSTPELLRVYAAHGRGRVLYNYLPDFYFYTPHIDSDVLGWPAAIQSHPDDPTCVGGAVARLVSEGAEFRVVSDPTGAGAAFGLLEDPPGAACNPRQWPAEVAKIGVGMAPLADTKFNASKSWLKPLEMSALGVPWVASPRAEYARLHAQGAGILADNPRRWYRELSRLRGDARLRREQGDMNRAAVNAMRISHQAWQWMEAWTDAVSIEHGNAPYARTHTRPWRRHAPVPA